MVAQRHTALSADFQDWRVRARTAEPDTQRMAVQERRGLAQLAVNDIKAGPSHDFRTPPSRLGLI